MTNHIQLPRSFCLLVFALASTATSFQPVSRWRTTQQWSTTPVFMAKKKKGKGSTKRGFGRESSSTLPPNKQSNVESSPAVSFTPIATKPDPAPFSGTPALPNTQLEESDRTEGNAMTSSSMNAGQKALAQMRREQAEKKDAELRRVKEIRDTDKMLQSSPEAAAIPEKVAMRMGKRMLPFVGIPLFGSMAAFVVFWYFATYKNMEFQPGMVATTTIVILASGLLGITYSIVSASWDEDREGSLLGVEEFQKNVGNIKEGLERSKENLVLREKMAGLPESEIEAAIADLERRDRRGQSFERKIDQELEK